MHQTAERLDGNAEAGPGLGRGPWPMVFGDAIVALVKQQILPRLAAAHKPAALVFKSGVDAGGIDGVRGYVELLLGPDLDDALGHVLALRSRGMGADAICRDLLAPAARCVQDLFDDDRCDFAAFSLGLWRLRMILHRLDITSDTVRDACAQPSRRPFAKRRRAPSASAARAKNSAGLHS